MPYILKTIGKQVEQVRLISAPWSILYLRIGGNPGGSA